MPEVIEPQPKPAWAPLPRPGCVNVQSRVLLSRDGLVVANLRFGRRATIDPHDAPYDIDVLCVAGAGFTRIGEKTFALAEGESVRWPAGEVHGLWTEDAEMETLMVERLDRTPRGRRP